MQPMTATPTPMPSTIVLKAGAVIGTDDQFTPVDGDTPHGGVGQSVDGFACLPSMVENSYHVHFYLGILVNGRQLALPDAIGLYEPGSEVNGMTDSAHCIYGMHTHDASGMVHVEVKSSMPLSGSYAPLGKLLDIWGERISSTAFGPFTGTVRVFYATTPLRSTYSGTYTEYTGNPWYLKTYSHEAIWIEVGPTYVLPAQLPRIRFYTEY